MKHHLTFLSTLLATTFLAGNALADIDFTEYDPRCGSSCRCYEDDSGNIIVNSLPEGPAPTTTNYGIYTYDKVSKKLIEGWTQYIYKGHTASDDMDSFAKYTYDDLGRQTEGIFIDYSPAYLTGIERYSRGIYQYNSDDPNEYYDASMYTVYADGTVDITYNNESFRLKDGIILSNENIEEVKKLINEGDLDKLVAYTGGQIDYYRTMDPNKVGNPIEIKTNNLGFSYLPIEYDDFSEGFTEVYQIPEMFVQNEDGSISVYDISAATANLSREELNAFIQNADPKDITGATLKGKYDSVVQYMLHGVLGYNASGSGDEDDASALAKKYNGTPLLYGKKIYTVEEAMEATKNGTKFHVGLTYK